jgi:hypothetical protein
MPLCPSIVVALQTEMRGFFASLRMTDKNNSNVNNRSRSPSGMTSKKCNSNDNSNGNGKKENRLFRGGSVVSDIKLGALALC